jgi:hypothetical protein
MRSTGFRYYGKNTEQEDCPIWRRHKGSAMPIQDVIVDPPLSTGAPGSDSGKAPSYQVAGVGFEGAELPRDRSFGESHPAT